MSRCSSRASGRCRISNSVSGAWSRPPSRSSTRPRPCSGLMLIGQGEVLRWVTATDPRAQVMEAAQERLGEGPCVEAFEQGGLQLISDTAAEERWPELTKVLRHDGVHAVLSVPVQVAQGTVGSLNF